MAPPVRGVPPSAPAFLTPVRANRALNAPGRHVRAEGVLAVNAVLRALVATWVQVAATLTEHGTPPLRAEALEASLPQLIGRPVLDRAVDGARAACAAAALHPNGGESDVEQVIPRAVTAAVVDEALVPFPAFRPPPDDAVTYVTGALAAIVMYLFDVLRHHDHPASTTDHDLVPTTVGVDEVARALADDPGLVAAYVNLDLGSLLDALVAAIRPRPMSGVALTPDSPSARTASPPPLTSTSRSASPAPTTDACESTPSTPARSRPASMERRRSLNAVSAPASGARGSRMSEIMTPSPGSLPRRPSAPVADPAKADEFESLLLSDETKKISLTPDRLRSMEPSPGLGPVLIATPPSTPPTTRRTSRRPGSMLVPVVPDLAAAAGLASPSPRTELPDPFASAVADPVANDSAVLNAQRASVVVAALTTGVGAAAAALVATGADQSAATGNISSDEDDDFLPNGRPRSGISGGNGAARRSSAAELTEFFNTTVPPSLSSAASVSTLEPAAAEGPGKSKKKRIFSMFGGATKRDKDKHRLSGGIGSPQLLTSQASIDSAATAAAVAAAKKYTMLPVPPGVDAYQPGAPPPNLVFADAGTIHTAPVVPRAASAPILARAASDARAPPITDDDGGPPPVARSSSLARSDSARAALARWGARDVADASPPPPASLGSSLSSSAGASARRGSAPPLRIVTATLTDSPVVAPAAEDDGPPPPRRRTSLRSAFTDARHGTRALAVDLTDSDRPSLDVDSSDMDRRASTPPVRTARRRSGPLAASSPPEDLSTSLANATRSDLEAFVCDLQARLAAAELARANADRAAAKAARKLHDMAAAVAARNATIAALQAENAELAHRLHSVLRVLAKAVPGLPVAEGGAGGSGSAASSRRGSPGPAGLVAPADA
ncbi:hypothetical protein GGF32_001046 [Allomyces javanicus]|nr:hypothetical protein GGF32_001046 [Allomyces javanicus]